MSSYGAASAILTAEVEVPRDFLRSRVRGIQVGDSYHSATFKHERLFLHSACTAQRSMGGPAGWILGTTPAMGHRRNPARRKARIGVRYGPFSGESVGVGRGPGVVGDFYLSQVTAQTGPTTSEPGKTKAGNGFSTHEIQQHRVTWSVGCRLGQWGVVWGKWGSVGAIRVGWGNWHVVGTAAK